MQEQPYTLYGYVHLRGSYSSSLCAHDDVFNDWENSEVLSSETLWASVL